MYIRKSPDQDVWCGPYLKVLFFLGNVRSLIVKQRKTIHPGCFSIRQKYTFVIVSKPCGDRLCTKDINIHYTVVGEKNPV